MENLRNDENIWEQVNQVNKFTYESKNQTVTVSNLRRVGNYLIVKLLGIKSGQGAAKRIRLIAIEGKGEGVHRSNEMLLEKVDLDSGYFATKTLNEGHRSHEEEVIEFKVPDTSLVPDISETNHGVQIKFGDSLVSLFKV